MKIYKNNGELLIHTQTETVFDAIQFCKKNNITLEDANLHNISLQQKQRSYIVNNYETFRHNFVGNKFVNQNGAIYEMVQQEYRFWAHPLQQDWHNVLICIRCGNSNYDSVGDLVTSNDMHWYTEIDDKLIENILSIHNLNNK